MIAALHYPLCPTCGLALIPGDDFATIGGTAVHMRCDVAAPLTIRRRSQMRKSLVKPVILVVLLSFAAGAAIAACGPKSAAFARAFIDCTTPDRAAIVDALRPTFESVITYAASPDGASIDTAPLKALTSKANLENEGGVVVGCAVKAAFVALATPAPAKAGAPQSAALVLDPAALARAYTELDAERFGGVEFRIAAP